MTRETAQAKGRRYLTEGRLVVAHVGLDGVSAHCRGDGEAYSCSWTAARGWRCTCPARSRCAHLLAVGLVVAVDEQRVARDVPEPPLRRAVEMGGPAEVGGPVRMSRVSEGRPRLDGAQGPTRCRDGAVTGHAEPLRRLLALVESGEVAAESGPERGLLTRLEGALATFDAGAADLDDVDRREAAEALRRLAALVEDETLAVDEPHRLARRLTGAAEAVDPARGGGPGGRSETQRGPRPGPRSGW